MRENIEVLARCGIDNTGATIGKGRKLGREISGPEFLQRNALHIHRASGLFSDVIRQIRMGEWEKLVPGERREVRRRGSITFHHIMNVVHGQSTSGPAEWNEQSGRIRKSKRLSKNVGFERKVPAKS